MLSINASLLFTMINLVVLVLLLRKFLYRPIVNIMEKREAMITESLKNASDEQDKAKALKGQYEEALNGAKQESAQLIEQARAEAKQEYERILNDADTQATKVITSARDTMDVERERTLRDMKTEVAGLAMEAARKIVEEHNAYDQFLKDAGDEHGGE